MASRSGFCLSILALLLFLTNSNCLHLGPGAANASTSDTHSTCGASASQDILLDVDSYPLAPNDLTLEQVYVFVRHGERTPVSVRLSRGPTPIPQHWMLCKTSQRFQEDIPETKRGPHEFLKKDVVLERVDGTVARDECLLGELTDIGRQTTSDYGRFLRRLYIDKLGFLPDLLRDDNQIYLRSTNVPRTIESLQYVIHGIYPAHKCASNVNPNILVRNIKEDNLVINTGSCKRLECLQVRSAKAAASAFNPTLEHLDKILSQYTDGNPIRVDGNPRASSIMDTVRAAIANGLRVPPEFEDKAIVDTIERAVVHESFADESEQLRRLAIGRLLGEIIEKMQRKVANGVHDPIKILVHTTHDTTLGGLCASLDVFDYQWPAFTAAVTFELFKKSPDTALPVSDIPQPPSQTPLSASKLDEYFVRMRYQNKSVKLPFCAPEGKHFPGFPEFCSFDALRERIKTLTPVDFERECSMDGDL